MQNLSDIQFITVYIISIWILLVIKSINKKQYEK